MIDIVDTAFSYKRGLIVCSFRGSFLQDFSKVKGSTLELIWNTHTAFILTVGQIRVKNPFNIGHVSQGKRLFTGR